MTKPLSIMPKFLWIDIIKYLPTRSAIALSQTHPQFDSMIDWEQCYRNRPDNIAIVFSNTNVPNWKHACITYVPCCSIKHILNILQYRLSSMNSNDFCHCVVTIKGGIYLYDNLNDLFELGHSNCNIEMHGSTNKHNRTLIYSTHTEEFIATQIKINLPSSFSIHHIDFVDVTCGLINQANINNSIIIDDCRFTQGKDLLIAIALLLESVCHITVTNCIFSMDNFGMAMSVVTNNALTLTIDGCQFDSKYVCTINKKNIEIANIHIDFTNNTVENCDYIFVCNHDITDIINCHDDVHRAPICWNIVFNMFDNNT